ncbi:MAG: ABC transporter ATP-binding protein [Pseudomonadota bacterium]
MNLIAAKQLTKRFGDHTAVDNVSLFVERGEVVGFLGPNGAGKSTTMRMIAGFLEPDSGSTAICDYDVSERPIDAKRRLGYLPEGAPAYSDMTVSDFLTFVGRIRGLAEQKLNNRLAEMVDQINLTGVWNQQIETLSKGFKRRVGIAQALIHDPDVLILDEPTDGLDPNQKHEMRTLIQSIAPNKAIIVSTHILEEVEAVCSRAVIIDAGKVVADETPHDLVARAADGNAIRITFAGEQATDSLVEKLKPLAGDGTVHVVGTFNGGTRVLVRPNGSAGPSPSELAASIAATDLVVEDIGVNRPRLEDVFREITGRQQIN